jgi:hypothetical protein
MLNERTLLAHGVWLDPEELALIAERGATIVTNPVANMKLAVGGVFPYPTARDAGVAVGLGTDGPGSSRQGRRRRETGGTPREANASAGQEEGGVSGTGRLVRDCFDEGALLAQIPAMNGVHDCCGRNRVQVHSRSPSDDRKNAPAGNRGPGNFKIR